MRFETNSFAQPRWPLILIPLAGIFFALEWLGKVPGTGTVGQIVSILAAFMLFRRAFTIYRLESDALYLSQGFGERRISLGSITSARWLDPAHLVVQLEFEEKTVKLYPKTPQVFWDLLERYRAAPARA